MDRGKEDIDSRLLILENNIETVDMLGTGEEIENLQSRQGTLERMVHEASAMSSYMLREGAPSTSDLRRLMNKTSVVEENTAVMCANLSDTDIRLQVLAKTAYEGKQLWKVEI